MQQQISSKTLSPNPSILKCQISAHDQKFIFDSSTSFVFSFDKLIRNYRSQPFNPTLSLLMLSRQSSNITIPTQTAFEQDSNIGDSDKNNPQTILERTGPVVLYRIREDRIIVINKIFISILAKLLLLCSILLLVIAIWIEYLMPQSFTAHTIRNGALPIISLHYALVLDSFLGLVASIVFTIMVVKSREDVEMRILSLVSIIGVCCMCGFLTMVYSFGANILYEYNTEEKMVKEIKSSRGETSSLWTNSQNFFKCCGIISYKSWDWNISYSATLKESRLTYPISCCDISLSPSVCKQKPNEAEIYMSGCLNQEIDFLLAIIYGIILLVILHFMLEAFAFMVTLKVYMRQMLIKKQTETVTISRPESYVSEVSNITEVHPEHGKFSEQTLLSQKYQKLQSEVKRSSTL